MDITLGNLVGGYLHFRLKEAGRLEENVATCLSQAPVPTYQTTWCDILKDYNFHIYCIRKTSDIISLWKVCV